MAGFMFLGPFKVSLMLRLATEYGLGGGSDGEGGGGVVDIVIVVVGNMSVFGRERSARHASSGDAYCMVDSTCL